MESIRRWWERYSIQLVLVCLGLVRSLGNQARHGVVVMEVYQNLSRPFQETYPYEEQFS
jgi:rod shape-determining protein MreC